MAATHASSAMTGITASRVHRLGVVGLLLQLHGELERMLQCLIIIHVIVLHNSNDTYPPQHNQTVSRQGRSGFNDVIERAQNRSTYSFWFAHAQNIREVKLHVIFDVNRNCNSNGSWIGVKRQILT